MLEIRQTNPTDVAAQALIAELDGYQRAIYPEQSNHLDPVEQLAKPNVCFAGAYNSQSCENGLLGIGAIKYLCHDCAYGEIKRLYVMATERGKGISKLIMTYLENDARKRGIEIVRLETGIYQPEAIGLYEKFGYQKCERFGTYLECPEDSMSVFMEKTLTKTPPAKNQPTETNARSNTIPLL